MVTPRKLDVLVIGAGVSGLTCAICLAEAGRTVRIVASERPEHTTSAIAGASWGPYLVKDDRILGWSLTTREALERIAGEDPVSGVRLVPGIEAAPVLMEPPSWAQTLDGFRACGIDELPDGYVSGWEYTIPLVDMPSYLAYLEQRAVAAGVELETATISRLDEVRGKAEVTVNCAGLGAGKLADDPQVFPTAGQLVIVENPGIEHFFQDVSDGEDLTYIFPHADYVVLGGSAVSGSAELSVDPDVTAGIIKRCTNVEPRLKDASVLGHRVGLRPTRGSVRLEREDLAGSRLVHNYGHGGSGLTLSWGCAREVQALVQGVLDGF